MSMSGVKLASDLRVKNIPVSRPTLGVREEEAAVETLRTGWIAQGPKVAEFEAKFAEYVRAPHAVAVSSCTTALHLALLAAGITRGDEVLCPSLSFIATANAIVYAGATPIFVDIDAATYNISAECIKNSITKRTKAILVAHQIGLPAALDEILNIAAEHGLVVIEDAACAIGSEYKAQRIGAPHSSLACFSFHPRKILTTGEGGMITTADAEVASHLRKLRQHAMGVSDLVRHSANKIVTESYDEVGFNYRMTDLQAAIGLVQLQRLSDFLTRRRMLAKRYSLQLSEVPWLVTPHEPSVAQHNFQSYMIRLKADAPITRDELMQMLLDRGISSRRGIMAIHREIPYKASKWDVLLPVTNSVTDSSVILPLFHEMTEEEQDHITNLIREIGTR